MSKRTAIAISVFLVLTTVFTVGHFKKREADYNRQRAALIEEKAELEGAIKSLREDVARKMKALAPLTSRVVELEKRLDSRNAVSRRSDTQAAGRSKTKKNGEILLIDKNCNLVIIDLGRREGVKENDRLKILKDGEEIAEATIIGVRYRASAAFVDEIEHRHNIRSIQKGDEVLISE
ncbi:MAG: hypothetical protein NG740_06530 [Omnitrophica bacterium]|nr:hypothetical protein [Candidatus Omnitrophota bacterium]